MAKAKQEKIAAYKATGRRKESIARVRLVPGTGKFIINNGRSLEEYFPRRTTQIQILKPLTVTGMETRFDIIARINGGGSTGQAGALLHSLARALIEADPELRKDLKKAGLLTRDPRMIERKKYGLKKARKRPQFSKR